MLEVYKDDNKEYRINFNKNLSSLSRVDFVKESELSKVFLNMVEATKQYMSWRKLLPKEAVQEIYLKNLQDRQKYYFEHELSELNNSLLAQKVHKSYMLRQTLIEFYNAISHLSVAYYGISPSLDNIKRAKSHFQRGALDSYKAIIKDFCYLINGKEVPEKIIQELKGLREIECNTIGNDHARQKDEVIEGYRKSTDNILNSFARNFPV